jgi:hypothetical protein
MTKRAELEFSEGIEKKPPKDRSNYKMMELWQTKRIFGKFKAVSKQKEKLRRRRKFVSTRTLCSKTMKQAYS